MGHFRFIGRKTGAGFIAVGGGGAASLKLGVNFAAGSYGEPQTIWTDLRTRSGAAPSSQDGTTFGLTAVGAGDLDANGNVKQMPAGSIYIFHGLNIPRTIQQYQITWDGADSSGWAIHDGGTLDGPVNYATRTALFTPTRSQADYLNGAFPGFLQIKYVITGPGYPTNIQVKPVGVSAKFDADLLTAKLPYIVGTGGIVRMMKLTNLEFGDGNGTAWNGGTSGAPVAIYTSTNRNRSAQFDWYARLEGTPFEELVDLANALPAGMHPWFTLPWNADNSYYDAFFTYLRDNLVGGKVARIEVSNEPWNTGLYPVAVQCFNEAAALGITSPQRYAQKAVAVFARAETIFAGQMSRIRRVLAWQNEHSTADFTAMLAFAGVAGHVDALSTAPYYYVSDTATFPTSYTGSTAALCAHLKDRVDYQLDFTVAHAAVAAANGLAFEPYEGGNHNLLSDDAYRLTFQHSADFHDCQAYYVEQFVQRVGNTPFAMFVYCYPNNNIVTKVPFGLFENSSQTFGAGTPKATAQREALFGQPTLQALTGTFAVTATATAGTLVGTVKRRVSGSTLALTGAGAANFTVSSSTGNVTVVNSSGLVNGTPIGFNIVETHASAVNGPTKTTAFSVTPSTAYRSFRLRTTVTPAGNGVGVAEFAAAVSAGGANALATGSASATSSFDATFLPANSIDGNVATAWASDFSNTWPQDLIIDLGSSSANWLAPYEFRITPRSGGNNLQAPGSFTIAGSTDLSSYTTLVTRTGETFDSAQTPKTYVV